MVHFFTKDATPGDKFFAVFLLGGIAAMFCYMGYRIAGTSDAIPEPGSSIEQAAKSGESHNCTTTGADSPIVTGENSVTRVVRDNNANPAQ